VDTHRAADFTEEVVRVVTGFLGGAPTVATTATLAVMAAATTGTAGEAMEADGTVDTGVSVSALAGIVLGILGEVTTPAITITGIMATPITDTIPTPTVLTPMVHTEGAWPHIFAGEGTGGMGPGGIFMHRPESMRPRELLHQPELLRRRELLRLCKFLPLMVNGTALFIEGREV